MSKYEKYELIYVIANAIASASVVLLVLFAYIAVNG